MQQHVCRLHPHNLGLIERPPLLHFSYSSKGSWISFCIFCIFSIWHLNGKKWFIKPNTWILMLCDSQYYRHPCVDRCRMLQINMSRSRTKARTLFCLHLSISITLASTFWRVLKDIRSSIYTVCHLYKNPLSLSGLHQLLRKLSGVFSSPASC